MVWSGTITKGCSVHTSENRKTDNAWAYDNELSVLLPARNIHFSSTEETEIYWQLMASRPVSSWVEEKKTPVIITIKEMRRGRQSPSICSSSLTLVYAVFRFFWMTFDIPRLADIMCITLFASHLECLLITCCFNFSTLKGLLFVMIRERSNCSIFFVQRFLSADRWASCKFFVKRWLHYCPG